MSAKYTFYEIVKVISDEDVYQEVNGLKGVILGMSENESGEWGYAVQIFDTDESWDLTETSLVSEGKFMKREELYDGDIAQVTVDPKTSEGKFS